MVMHWIDDLVVVCPNLDRHELNPIFLRFSGLERKN